MKGAGHWAAHRVIGSSGTLQQVMVLVIHGAVCGMAADCICAPHYRFPLICSPFCGPVEYWSVISPPMCNQLPPFLGHHPSVDLTPPTPPSGLPNFQPVTNCSDLASTHPCNSFWQSS